RALFARLFEVLAERLPVDQREVLLFEPQHRRAAGGIIRIERVAGVPRRLAPALVADALLAQRWPGLAAERTEGEVIELPHGLSRSCRKPRAASTGWRLDYSRMSRAMSSAMRSPIARNSGSISSSVAARPASVPII